MSVHPNSSPFPPCHCRHHAIYRIHNEPNDGLNRSVAKKNVRCTAGFLRYKPQQQNSCSSIHPLKTTRFPSVSTLFCTELTELTELTRVDRVDRVDRVVRVLFGSVCWSRLRASLGTSFNQPHGRSKAMHSCLYMSLLSIWKAETEKT